MADRALYIPHGGGPLPLLGDPAHLGMVDFLRTYGTADRPRAVVVVSAHWECPSPTITSAPHPDLYFDYYGFPPETYELEYSAPGDPELAARLAELLTGAGFDPLLDRERGFDHGMFVPLLLMFPDASIPVVQLSLLADLDPARHIALGAAIAPVVDDDVLVLGSGMSFHNMSAFAPGRRLIDADPENEAFDEWLEVVCTDPVIDEPERSDTLSRWEDAPAARYNHPREEHLLPLHVCYGVGGGPAERAFDGHVLDKHVAAYRWN